MFKFIERRHLWVAFFIIYSFIAFASYWQSLDSFLVFDDTPNLYALSNTYTLEDKIRYSFSSIAGHRYLSYASFALQAEAFRGNNYFALKLVNLLLHSASAILVFIFCFYLQKLIAIKNTPTSKQQVLLALACSSLWFAHPIHVNTVLYTIQRMTVLAGLLTLSGLSFATYYLNNAVQKQQTSPLIYLATIFVIAALAILSKETGILLFAFLLLLHQFIQQENLPKHYFNQACFLLPILVLIIYLIASNRLNFSYRDFSMAQRLYTQPEIILSYINKLLLSWPSKFSLYHDQYPVVTSAAKLRFFIPTLVLSCIVTLAVIYRKKQPLISFGILFFFAGHLLESTFIPLELYFDHRNYIPSVGFIISLVGAMQLGINANTRHVKAFTALLFIAFSLNNVINTAIETSSWKSQERFIRSNLNDTPMSLRTWQSLAEYQANNGDYTGSIKTLEYIQNTFGFSVANQIHILWQQCIMQQQHASHHSYTGILDSSPQRQEFKATSSAMQTLLIVIKNQNCKAIGLEQYRTLLEKLIATSRYRTERYNMYFLLTESYISEKKYAQALAASMDMPAKLLRGDYLLMQMNLAFKTGNMKAAKIIYNNIQFLPKVDRLSYQKQLNAISETLKKVKNNGS